MKGDFYMASIFRATFGGLAPAYYFRHLAFGLVFPGFLYLSIGEQDNLPWWQVHLFSIISTLLYPYARFLYERVVGFILGDNVYYVNGWVMLSWKLVTMTVCWGLAVAIAPVGLVYLFLHHSRASKGERN